MKFMKLGSKPDSFQTDGNNVRIAATEYGTDFIVNVRDVKFYVHKFPLLSKSYRLQKMYSDSDEIHISDIPGGPAAFEICAKFCYGMIVTLNAYNVAAVRCSAGYLEMYQTIDSGNLINKIDAFLDTSISRSWKDSIIVLRSTNSLLPWAENLKLVSRCIDSIASKVSVDTSKVDWSYTYNWKKLPSEFGVNSHQNGVRRQQSVPKDWWIEDLCELEIDFYKRAMTAINAKGRISGEVMGEALKRYTYRRLPGFRKGSMIHGGDTREIQMLLETIISLLPADKGSVSCSFLLKVHRVASLLGSSEMYKKQLVKKIGSQLERASVQDLLIPAVAGDTTIYDIDTIIYIVEEFVMQDSRDELNYCMVTEENQEIMPPVSVSCNPKLNVAKLVDGYLAEIAKDPNVPFSKFVHLAELVSGDSRPLHDGLYHAIDMYLKVHLGLSKSERKSICSLMDCKRLSAEACAHAVQNERLPMRVVVQVLFFEQVRSSVTINTASTNRGTGSFGSLTSATTANTENWNVTPMVDYLKSIRSLTLVSSGSGGTERSSSSRSSSSDANQKGGDRRNDKVKGILMRPKKRLSTLWSGKVQGIVEEDTKSMPMNNARYSVS